MTYDKKDDLVIGSITFAPRETTVPQFSDSGVISRLEAQIKSLTAERDELRKMVTWRDIKDAPRDDGGFILGWSQDMPCPLVIYWREAGKEWVYEEVEQNNAYPTHWMPLPTPPKEEGDA